MRGTLLMLMLMLMLMLALSVPWYVVAERHTPGFLNYFLLGEHWHRFVTPGWGGDLAQLPPELHHRLHHLAEAGDYTLLSSVPGR